MEEMIFNLADTHFFFNDLEVSPELSETLRDSRFLRSPYLSSPPVKLIASPLILWLLQQLAFLAAIFKTQPQDVDKSQQSVYITLRAQEQSIKV